MAPVRWSSYHLVYHGDLDLALHEFVRPTVARLLADGRIDRFFFVRYGLGGPHLRLRLRRRAGGARALTRETAAAAAAFLDRWPSRQPLSEEVIRRHNRGILTVDPEGREDLVYPDNSFLESPLALEIERYGGPALAPHSLDFFVLSSVHVLRLLAEYRGAARARRLSAAGGVLAAQAAGLAHDDAELLALLDYAAAYWGRSLAPIAAEGDRAFERGRDRYRELVRRGMTEAFALEPSPAAALGEAACRLAREIAGANAASRERVGTSQMHMTANRLGLSNPEEVYLGRLLVRAARDLLENEPGVRRQLSDLLATRKRGPAPPRQRLRDLLLPALAELGESAGGSAAPGVEPAAAGPPAPPRPEEARLS